jgi:hypothetical protein
VNARAFNECDLFTLEVGNRLDRAVLRNQDRLVFWRRSLAAGIDNVGASCLREDRRRIADFAEIGGPDVERLQKLRPGREFSPDNRPAAGLQRLFDGAALLEQNQVHGAFLISDAEHLIRGKHACGASPSRGERDSGDDGATTGTGHGGTPSASPPTQQ